MIVGEEETPDYDQLSKKTKIHGFKKHVVSNFLQDRHPYLQPPFNQRYDPKEVYHAVFDRSIPKLVEILDMQDLPDQSYREAFMLLNEMSSHQENKIVMIDSGLVCTSISYMRHPDSEVRRESTNLLGSLLSLMRGRDQLAGVEIDQVFPDILMKDELKCREVCGWMLCRMCSGRDGVDILINTNQIQYIIKSFRANSESYDKKEAMFLIYMLECMASILQTDKGIENFVSTTAIKRFNEILIKEEHTYGEYENRIRYLCLLCSSLIEMNDEGKEESIRHGMIETANRYLNHEDEHIANAATRVIMFASIDLKGKTKSVEPQGDVIIRNLIDLLEHKNRDIVRNAEITLMNISDLPKGFMIICKYLSSHLTHLDKIFGPMAIIPLYGLLFKIDRPPFITQENKVSSMKYALAISYFINNAQYKRGALDYAIERACKIVERMIPLLLNNEDAKGQAEIAKAIEVICIEDEVNRTSFQAFIAKHGDTHCEVYQTKLLVEIAKFKELFDLFQMREEEKEKAKDEDTEIKMSASQMLLKGRSFN